MKKFFSLLIILVLSLLSLQAQSLRVELEELHDNISKYKIIDVREADLYNLAHLPNALNFPVNLTYHDKSTNGKLIQPMKMQEELRKLGLDTDDKIVVYDDGTIFDASRVFWALEVYGFKNVKLLNGGYEQWEKLNYPLNSQDPTISSSNYIATIDNQRLATKFSTQIATKNPNQIIIDARERKAYLGKVSVAKRFGHIPKAIHIPAIHNLTKKEKLSALKPTKQLQHLYKDIKKDKKIVIYCAVGRIASTNYFALRELGYNVANYDASWKEWGNDFNLPIVNLSKNQK